MTFRVSVSGGKLLGTSYASSGTLSPMSSSPVPVVTVPRPPVVLLVSTGSGLAEPFLMVGSMVPFATLPGVSSSAVGTLFGNGLNTASGGLSFKVAVAISTSS